MASNGIPLHYTELDPEIAKRATEGYDDELTGEQKKLEALYRQHSECPRGCSGTMQKHAAHPNFAFGSKDWLVPRCLLKCSHCGCVLNPFDGMIVELGDPDTANAGGHVVDPNTQR